MIQPPLATYRLQVHAGFTFEQARQILPYLAELGISDIYASPIFHARAGSTHGYDVLNPNEFNPELGAGEDFRRLNAEAKALGLGWLQDIVPNHMAFDRGNPYLADVMENGEHSRYFHFFDVQWDHFFEILHGRILAPFLGGFFGEALENGQLRLAYDRDGFSVGYYEMRFPLRIDSYLDLLGFTLDELRRRLGEGNADYIQLLGVMYVLKTLRSGAEEDDRYNQIVFVKETLWGLFVRNPLIRRAIEETVARFNGEPGNRESFNLLERLLAEQNFRLAFWRVASEEINYRRFFSINDLISLRPERREVFEATHDLVLRLVGEGRISGLRVDHIDGLCHPQQYLEWLREKAGNVYLVVEKILEMGEPLVESWPIQGTTGYEYMNRVGGLFCHRDHAEAFSRIYQRFSGLETDYEELVYEKKKLIIERWMIGDINNLVHLLKNIASRHRYGSDITLYSLRRCLMEIMASFPVYRSYLHPGQIRPVDREHIRRAVAAADARNPGLGNELRFVEKVLLLQVDDFLPEEEKEQWLHFVMRFQQFTGPLMAKGFEDTLLYVYNRLISLNEVGGAPERFGTTLEEFHDYCRQRREKWPQALSASATHDHKRGEDVRARLNVLSELPKEWANRLTTWHRLNRGRKGGKKKSAPARTDAYLLYQTLLGTWPFDGPDENYRRRLGEYMVKAVREAKVYTAWVKPDLEYEEAAVNFIEGLLEDEAFLREFLPFQRRIAFYGVFNSLAQTLLKLTTPGVPDIYQGTELWDLSLVDPDNRRPVDYGRRRELLTGLREGFEKDREKLLEELLHRPEDGRIKLFLIWRALEARHRYRPLFEMGDYIPLTTSGPPVKHLLAFARVREEERAVVLVPRFLTSLVGEGNLPLGPGVWGDAELQLPQQSGRRWQNALTGETLQGGSHLPVAEVLRRFPAALLLQTV